MQLYMKIFRYFLNINSFQSSFKQIIFSKRVIVIFKFGDKKFNKIFYDIKNKYIEYFIKLTINIFILRTNVQPLNNAQKIAYL